MYSQKIKPSIAKYIDYKDFDNNDLKKQFIRELFSDNLQSNDLSQFENISKIRLEEKEPFKKRYAKYNQAKFINKNLPKAIVKYVQKKKKKQPDLNIKDRDTFVKNY